MHKLIFLLILLVSTSLFALTELQPIELEDVVGGAVFNRSPSDFPLFSKITYLNKSNQIVIIDRFTGVTEETIEIKEIFDVYMSITVTQHWFDEDNGYEVIYTGYDTVDNKARSKVYDGDNLLLDENGYLHLTIYDNKSYLTNTFGAANTVIKTWLLNSDIGVLSGNSNDRNSLAPQYHLSNNKFRIQLNGSLDKSATLQIFDLKGRIIADVPAVQLQSGNAVVDFSGAASGMYLPVLKDGNRVHSEKIIKR